MQTRNSHQRKIILEILKDNYTHPTADEIYEKARTLDSHISKGTVYRNLGLLSDKEEIKKISVPNGSDHYDCQLHEHYHFCCSECNKMFDVPETITIATENISSLMAKDGFAINAHCLIFTGLCPNCNK